MKKSLALIKDQLSHMEEKRANFIACFAFLMGRVADADFDIGEDELAKIEAVLAEHSHLEAPQVKAVVELAKAQSRIDGSVDTAAWNADGTLASPADLLQLDGIKRP